MVSMQWSLLNIIGAEVRGSKTFFLNSNLIECYECCRQTSGNTEHEEQKLLVGTPFAYVNQHLEIEKYYAALFTDGSYLV